MKQSSKWLRAFNVFLSSILALLGYTSCGESSVEYGTLYAKYEIKGKVTDKENKNAVSGARVIVKALNRDLRPLSSYFTDTVYTDKEGNYIYQNEDAMSENYQVVCEDPSNTYQSDSTRIKMEPEGGEGWYQGSDSRTVDFELDKKKP